MNLGEKPSITSLRVGRSLKEMKVLPSGLGSQTPTLPMLQQKRPILSADGNMSIDALKRKIRDLEFENQKLKSHVDQAEKSIHNFRGFLHKSNSDTKSVACQSDPVRSYDIRNAGSIVNNMSGRDPEKELQAVKRERDNLRVSVENLSSLLNEKTHALELRAIADAAAATNVGIAIEPPVVVSASMNTSMSLDMVQVPRTQLMELHRKAVLYRLRMHELKHACAEEMNEFRLALEVEYRSKIAECLQQLSLANQIQQLVLKKASQSSVPSTPLHSNIQAGSPGSKGSKPLFEALSPVHHRDHGRSSKDCTPSGFMTHLQHSTPNMKLGSVHVSSPPVMLVSKSASGPKLPSLQGTPESVSHTYMATSCQTSPVPKVEAEVEATLSVKDAQVLQQHLQQQQQHLQQQLTIQVEKYDNTVREHNATVSSLRDDLSALRERNRTLTAQLTRAHDYFAGHTLDRVKQEVAAVKQSAHVKDLTKVAAARELTLEKDSLMNEVAFKK